MARDASAPNSSAYGVRLGIAAAGLTVVGCFVAASMLSTTPIQATGGTEAAGMDVASAQAGVFGAR